MKKSTLTIVTCAIIGLSAVLNIGGITLLFTKGTTMFGLYYIVSIMISVICIYFLWKLNRLALIIYSTFFVLSIAFFAATGTLSFFKPFYPVVIIILMLLNYKQFKLKSQQIMSTQQNQIPNVPASTIQTTSSNSNIIQEDKLSNKIRVTRIISVVTAFPVGIMLLLLIVMSHDSPASQGDNMLLLINFAMVLIPAIILIVSLKSNKFYLLWFRMFEVVFGLLAAFIVIMFIWHNVLGK